MRIDISVLTVRDDDRDGGSSDNIIETAGGDLYKFVSEFDNDLYWIKSTNGGLSWSVPVSVIAGTITGVSCWYDRWTPGDAGNLIHIAVIDQVSNDIIYDSLNTSNDTLSGNVQVFNGVSLAGGSSSCVSITKAVGGNLYIAFDGDGGTETGLYRSTDGGATWASRSSPVETATTDYFSLFPGNESDNQDILIFYWDRSADEISLKIYDDSANTVSETSIATSMVDVAHSTVCSQFSGSVRLSDGLLFITAWSNRDTATAKLRAWSIGAAADITELTNVVSSSGDDQQACALSIDQDENIYVYYMGKSDGSETVGTSVGIYCKKSTNAGATWGSETQISENNRNYSYLKSSPLLYGNHKVIYAVTTQNTAIHNLYISKTIVRKSVFMNGGFS